MEPTVKSINQPSTSETKNLQQLHDSFVKSSNNINKALATYISSLIEGGKDFYQLCEFFSFDHPKIREYFAEYLPNADPIVFEAFGGMECSFTDSYLSDTSLNVLINIDLKGEDLEESYELTTEIIIPAGRITIFELKDAEGRPSMFSNFHTIQSTYHTGE